LELQAERAENVTGGMHLASLLRVRLPGSGGRVETTVGRVEGEKQFKTPYVASKQEKGRTEQGKWALLSLGEPGGRWIHS